MSEKASLGEFESARPRKDRALMRLQRVDRAANRGDRFHTLPFHSQDRGKLEVDPGPTLFVSGEISSTEQDVFGFICATSGAQRRPELEEHVDFFSDPRALRRGKS